MRTKIFGALAAGALTIAVCYLVGAFVTWDLNPENWGETGRMVFALVGITCTILGGLVVPLFWEDAE